MTKATETILKALEEVHDHIRTTPLERLEAAAWTAWQRGDQEGGFDQFEADWRSGDLFPLLVWSLLAGKYGAVCEGEER